MVLLLTGFFGSYEGSAFNDFETMSDGPITEVVGEINYGGCVLEHASFGTR